MYGVASDLLIFVEYSECGCLQARPACIPDAVIHKREAMDVSEVKRMRKLEREIELEMSEEYFLDLKSKLLLSEC